jgi:hypothetical protein
VGVSYKIDPQRRCIVTTLSGTVTDWDLTAVAQGIWQDPRFDPGFARLVDCKDVTDTTVSPELCRAIASDFRGRTQGKVAVVATSDINLMRRLADIYSQHLQPAEVARFLTREEALRWLGVQEIEDGGREDELMNPFIPQGTRNIC